MRIPAVLFVLLLTSSAALSATYHVSPSGLDDNDGNEGDPWLTLQHAADTVAGGDTVLVEDGTYDGFTLLTSGSAGSPITFRAKGSGAVINTVGNWRGDNVCVEADYVIIEGFISEAADRAGFTFLPPSGSDESFGCEIRYCTARDNGRWGIFSGFCCGLAVERNECYGSGLEHGIYVSCTSDYPVIRGNVCHDNAMNGIQTNGANSGWGDHVISHALIEENVVYHNDAKGLSIIGTSDSTIRNNLIYENGPAAGGIHFAPQNGMQSTDNVVVNNTVIEPGMSAVRLSNASSGIKIFNNVLYGTRAIAVEDPAYAAAGFDSDYNVLGGSFVWEFTYPDFAGWQGMGYDANSVEVTSADEVCNDPGGDDYRLFAGSPAADLGVAQFASHDAPDADIEGLNRPGGSGYDAGCYEHDGVDVTAPGVLPTMVQIAVNVTDDSGSIELTVDGASYFVSPGAWTSSWIALPGPATIAVGASDASGNSAEVDVGVAF
ncbi:MAG: right-handed parallel beta-helix repeat-containing protein [Planctomycetes bacterium]|nr:right-handed parallel beta-helix repeat-containing protein [Planctomycetota bacterium]